MMTEVKNMAKPEKRFRCGGCEAAVFENEITRGGKAVKVKKTAIQKRYKSATQGWQTTYSLDVNDINSFEIEWPEEFAADQAEVPWAPQEPQAEIPETHGEGDCVEQV
jgi:hypothetical protein